MVLIPFPRKLSLGSGFFSITVRTEISLESSCDYMDFEAAQLLREDIEKHTGIRLRITRVLAGWSGLLEESSGRIVLRKGLSGSRENEAPAGEDGAFVRDNRAMSGESIATGENGPSVEESKATTGGDVVGNAAGIQPFYRITVREGMILVEGLSGNGLLHGIQTLRQIVRSSAPMLPCCEIEDWPDFETRGFYHDITRGKVPSLETLKELADRLSFYKGNQLQLYVEHSFAFDGHSEIWIDSDPITQEEILVLDEYCKKRGIELVPSLSTFGHLYHLLISKGYRHLNEYEEPGDAPFTWIERMQHHTLDVSNPQSLELVCGMIDEFLPLFSSGKFNICCDETFDLGRGRNKALADEVGKGTLYLDFVSKIIRHVKSRGKQVMMWGDILLKYPGVLKELPSDVILLNWGYSPEVTEDGTKSIAEAGLTQYACPGVQGWNKLVNHMDNADRNIRAMVSHGCKYGAQGVLNTDWGDFGHVNLFANSMPGMIYGAALAWNPEGEDKPSDEEISILEYGDKSGRIIGLMREVSRQTILDWETMTLWYHATTGSNVESYGYRNYYLQLMLNSQESAIRNAYEKLTELKRELMELYSGVYPERRQDVREFQVSAEGVALSQALLLVIKKNFLEQNDTGLILNPRKLAERLEYWLASYKEVWRTRNRESELYRIKEVIMGICRLLREVGCQ